MGPDEDAPQAPPPPPPQWPAPQWPAQPDQWTPPGPAPARGSGRGKTVALVIGGVVLLTVVTNGVTRVLKEAAKPDLTTPASIAGHPRNTRPDLAAQEATFRARLGDEAVGGFYGTRDDGGPLFAVLAADGREDDAREVYEAFTSGSSDPLQAGPPELVGDLMCGELTAGSASVCVWGGDASDGFLMSFEGTGVLATAGLARAARDAVEGG